MDNEIYHLLEAKIKVPRHPYTQRQLHILKRIIKQKHITKVYFNDVLYYAFNCQSYKQLDYEKMYRLIFILSKSDTNKL